MLLKSQQKVKIPVKGFTSSNVGCYKPATLLIMNSLQAILKDFAAILCNLSLC